MFFRRHRPPTNRIFLRNFILDMEIGVLDWEKGRRQRVRIDLDVVPARWPDEKYDDIAGTVSYDDLKKIAERHARSGHIHLVETLAERIAHDALAETSIREIRVRVEKLEIYPDAVPGVEIVRVKR